MKLYHGSNTVISKPAIINSIRGLDFGMGFYTTSNYKQAVRFTDNVVKRKKQGEKTVSIYQINEKKLFAECSFMRFEQPNELWLDFVVKNRTLSYQGKKYDLITGPVANDTVYNVIDLYISGVLNKDETIKRLKVRKLFNQWTFCTEKALTFLTFIDSKIIA